MTTKPKPDHQAADFELDPLNSEDDMFRWFLLCYLFGKPIRSTTSIETWRLFIERQLDTPWAILEAGNYGLVLLLREGGYARYQHVTADGLEICMDQLIRSYDGSIMEMLYSSQTEGEFSKRLQKLHGVGPKMAEIFMRETQEYFARRAE